MSGNDQVIRRGKGTAVSNTYQKNRRRGEADPPPAEVIVPEQVVVPVTGTPFEVVCEVKRIGSLPFGMPAGTPGATYVRWTAQP